MNVRPETLRGPSPEELDLQQLRRESKLIETQLIEPDGILHGLADAKTTGPLEDDPRKIASVIIDDPDATEKRAPRADLLDKTQAETASKEIIKANSRQIIGLAERLGMRKLVNGERQPENIEAIDPRHAVFVVEGGANKSSIIRRGVAIKGMREVYRQNNEPLEEVDLSGKTLYQFGAAREIAPTKDKKGADGTTTKVPNPEYETIRSLAGEHLPEEGPFTEFTASVATALADGYRIRELGPVEGNNKLVTRVELTHETNPLLPKLVIIQPAAKGKFKDGLTALHSLESLESKQLVMATNGQYRRKDECIAPTWAKDNNVNMLQSIALGDEPGDTFTFKGGEIKTDPRPEAAYVNEFVILWYLAQRRLRDMPDASAADQPPQPQLPPQQAEAENADQQHAQELAHTMQRFVKGLFDVLGMIMNGAKTTDQRVVAEQKRLSTDPERLGAFIVGLFAIIVIAGNNKPASELRKSVSN